MKRIFFVLALVIASCNSVQVSFDYDKSAVFTKYKTYSFTDESMKLGIPELTRNRVIAAVEKEMAARGFTKAASPDVQVDLITKLNQRQEATATSTGGGMYGRPYAYGGGFTTTRIDVNTYIEGTLFINIVDKAQNKLVWSGRGTKTLDENASAEKQEANINNAVKLIFSRYPVKAATK